MTEIALLLVRQHGGALHHRADRGAEAIIEEARRQPVRRRRNRRNRFAVRYIHCGNDLFRNTHTFSRSGRSLRRALFLYRTSMPRNASEVVYSLRTLTQNE